MKMLVAVAKALVGGIALMACGAMGIFHTGERVKHQICDGGTWWPGYEVRYVNRDGTYDITDNGKLKFGVSSNRIMRDYSAEPRAASAVQPASSSSIFTEGTRVEYRVADFDGASWFKGEIRFVNNDGTYDIRADHSGELEFAVPKSRMIRDNTTSTPASSTPSGNTSALGVRRTIAKNRPRAAQGAKLAVGAKVEILSPYGNWFKAEIRLVNNDGTYVVRKEHNGEYVRNVARNRLVLR